MYELHQSTSEAMHFQAINPYALPPGESELARTHTFLRDSMLYMRWIRESYQKLQLLQAERKNKEEENKKQNIKHSETEIVRETSTEAFLTGGRARILQVEWDAFFTNSPEPDLSVLSPIEVVASEPDARLISQLELSPLMTKTKKEKKKKKLEGVERPKDGTLSTEVPLPERIRITSTSLISIMETFEQKPDIVPGVKSAVFLRPFQDLVYNEGLLREQLASLEKRYENYDSNQAKLESPPASQDGSNAPGDGDPSAGTGTAATELMASRIDVTRSETSEDQRKEAASAKTEKDGVKDNKEEASPDDGVQTSIAALLHLRCLMEFIDSEIMPKEKYFRGNTCTHIRFHDLWHLFRPGDELIDHNERQAYVVLRVQVPVHKIEDPWEQWNTKSKPVSDTDSDASSVAGETEDGNPFTLYCAHIDFDGKSFGPVAKKFRIPPFGDRKAIRSLPVYPFRLAKGSETRQNFIKRSRMLLDVAKFKAMYYMGVTVDTRDEVDSQVVIDFNEALADQSRRKMWEPLIKPISTAAESRDDECASICCRDQSVTSGKNIDDALTEEYIKTLLPKNSLQPPSLILSPRSLEETLESVDELTDAELLIMTYPQLDLSFLHYENANARDLKVGAFDRLELPQGHREMVKSLVIQHFRSKKSVLARDEPTDLVQGKGRCLVFLRRERWDPEGISELFKKPLFQITCGDLGTTAKEVEAELEKNFALASRWGCILLLDEADVFLSARERVDFQRNGLVAVFLRVLEYYTGILFLTTNRVGDFDEAFASRIHMSLYYPELDKEKTLKVFQLNLDLIQERFNKHGRSIIFDVSSIKDFAEQHFDKYKYSRWNGRQIRNACQTALALAEFDAQGSTLDIDTEFDKDAVVRLELKYFKTVQRAYLDFGKYLGDIRGTQGDRRAIDFMLRARTNTPYEAKPNLFSREDRQSNAGQSLNPQYMRTQSDMTSVPQHGYGHSEDLYVQSYPPGTPSPGRPQSYGQYPMYAQQPQGYDASPVPGSHRPYMERPSGGLETPQQGQMDPRFTQGVFRGQFESPPRGN
ncbi:hypothetical protein B0I35DRAFT_454214 [Stachybotrys elegans]|uniref:ATPase AAA-type core domain-containing protein n=1 Tax=Stachybotrys elegans TaxID=80388 RepID=A0A8K0WLV5_9HYPO|nr:hypothetical protein B0I35DRAFT_454214 [Stachybotrys elegans]